MNDHRLKIVYEDNLRLEFECLAGPQSFCRMRPLAQDVDYWDKDTILDSGGHKCIYKEWADDLGIEEAFLPGYKLPSVLSTVPVKMGFDNELDSPMIIGVTNE